MRLDRDFIDCTNDNSDKIKLIREKLVNKLPDNAVVRLANILAIDTKSGVYVVKVRKTFLKEDGSTDIEKVHRMIKDSDFLLISSADYCGIDKGTSISSRTMQLMKPGDNIIFKMNIDVDKLV